jgi:hypothetical protein
MQKRRRNSALPPVSPPPEKPKPASLALETGENGTKRDRRNFFIFSMHPNSRGGAY